MRWKALSARLAAATVVSAAAFGGGGCSSDGQRAPASATFLPAERVPAAGQVFLALETASGQVLGLSVRVHEVSGIGQARLLLSYDPRRVVFRDDAEGALLEQGGAAVIYEVGEQVPGLLSISVRRVDPGTAQAGSDDPILVHLAFVVVASGQAPATFQPLSFLADDQGSALERISFFGGTFLGL